MEIKNEKDVLENVSGGLANDPQTVREAVLSMLPAEVRNSLGTETDPTVLNDILAKAGIDPVTVDKRLNDMGFNTKSIGLALADSDLEKISGGFTDEGHEISCMCGNKDRKKFTYQPLCLIGNIGTDLVYSCDCCGLILEISKSGVIHCFDLDQYRYKLFVNRTYMP